jgi:hypothetical protein
MAGNVPVLNLASGASYGWTLTPDAISNPDDVRFLRRIASYCLTTTCRDSLALRLFRDIGVDCELIPCSALLAPFERGVADQAGSYILANVMKLAGHYDYGQKIDVSKWLGTVSRAIRELSRRHTVRMLCHSEEEFALAASIAPDCERLFPQSEAEYYDLVRGAKTALCNRVHAAVYLAGIGVPSVTICNDTRMLILSPLDLPHHFIEDVSADQLIEEVETQIACRRTEGDRLHDLKMATFARYTSILERTFKEKYFLP